MANNSPEQEVMAVTGGLFQSGEFTLASGQPSSWKIDCDFLRPSDWRTLAAIAADLLPPFGDVVGVPRGGIDFARALKEHVTESARPLLVVDDVWTTGESMRVYAARHHPNRYWLGCVVFARSVPDYWVKALFTMPERSDWHHVHEPEATPDDASRWSCGNCGATHAQSPRSGRCHNCGDGHARPGDDARNPENETAG